MPPTASQGKGEFRTRLAVRTALGRALALCELYGTGGGRRPALTWAVVFFFLLPAGGLFISIEKRKRNSRGEERMGSKWSKMQVGLWGAKYALYSDTASPAVPWLKLDHFN